MELSKEFIENAIFGENTYNCFQSDQYDKEIFDELHKLIMTENYFEERFLRSIKKIQTRNYTEARRDLFEAREFTNEMYSMRCVIKSLLKGIIATSSFGNLSEVEDAKFHWKSFENQQKLNDPQGHHDHVYRKFKQVQSMEELGKFNDFFNNYILELVYRVSETFICRLHYTIEYLRDEKQFDEACAKGIINLEKFKKDLEEIKNFKPE